MFAHKKIYLSLSQSRQLASEYPIGDPFGGPAYGGRELFGLIAGAVAIFEGVTAISAVGFTIAAGAAIVGGALTVIGTLTGDANLTQIGGIIGLGGAAVSLATGGWEAMSNQFSSWFGDGAALSADAAKGLSDFGIGSASTANNGFANIPDFTSNATGGGLLSSNVPVVADVAGDAALGMSGSTSAAPANTGAFGAAEPVSPSFLTDTAAIDKAVGNVGASPITADPSVTQATQQSGAAGTIGTNNATGSAQANGGYMGPRPDGLNISDVGEMAGGSSAMSGVTKFFKENSELVKMLGQGTASLFERVSPSEKSKAETLAMKANAGATDARAELDRWTLQLKQQQANNANTVVSPGLLGSQTAGNVTRTGANSYMPRTTYAPA